MPLGRDPCKMTAETLEFMIEETGSDYARNKTPEKVGQKFCVIRKTNFFTDQFIKIFNLASTVKYGNRLLLKTHDTETRYGQQLSINYTGQQNDQSLEFVKATGNNKLT